MVVHIFVVDAEYFQTEGVRLEVFFFFVFPPQGRRSEMRRAHPDGEGHVDTLDIRGESVGDAGQPLDPFCKEDKDRASV